MVELNDETRWILGRPNFWCAPIARCLREMGHSIEERSEDEQAAVIYWLLCLYENHGDKWREVSKQLLRENQARRAEGKDGNHV